MTDNRFDVFKITISGDELRRHCRKRADYHDARAVEKEAELPGLRETLERIKAGSPSAADQMRLASYSNTTTNYRIDPDQIIEQLEADIGTHKSKAKTARLFAEHLPEDEYRLTPDEARRVHLIDE